MWAEYVEFTGDEQPSPLDYWSAEAYHAAFDLWRARVMRWHAERALLLARLKAEGYVDVRAMIQ